MSASPAPSVQVVEFDFESRREREISLEEAAAARGQGHSLWIDVDLPAGASAASILADLGVNANVIEEAMSEELAGRFDLYDDCLHVGVAAPEMHGGDLQFRQVEMVLGERFIVTLRRGPVEFLDVTRRNYRRFFAQFAQTLGFLLFEFWDHLIEGFRQALHVLEDQVEVVQVSIFGSVDDTIFSRVAELTNHLLTLRRNILADREALHQMSIRKTLFVSDTTRPYLVTMVSTLERLGSDMAVERQILSDTVNLYLGITGHRTNRLIRRLTLISVIFLPLTFLCGVYGMNFQHMPEKDWAIAYPAFWLVCAGIVAAAWCITKWTRWLG